MAVAAAAAIAGTAPAQAEESAAAMPHEMPATMPASWIGKEQIAMLAYPGMTALDLVAPQYCFAALMGATVKIVAKTMSPIVSDTGLTILPSVTFADCERDLDILFAPGGAAGTLKAMKDDATLDFIADRGARARLVTSVCTGSLLLGAAGLLKGYRATSHWAARAILPQFGAEPVDQRVVSDRNRITGAGVTAGMDFGLTVVARLRDDVYAQGVQLGAEYAPQPPFNAGTPEAAPEEVRQIMASMYAGFQTQAAEAAQGLGTRRR